MSDLSETNDAPVTTRVLASALIADEVYQTRVRNSMVWALTTGVVLPVGLRVVRWAFNRRQKRRKDRRADKR
jgi:hypothetical protein